MLAAMGLPESGCPTLPRGKGSLVGAWISITLPSTKVALVKVALFSSSAAIELQEGGRFGAVSGVVIEGRLRGPVCFNLKHRSTASRRSGTDWVDTSQPPRALSRARRQKESLCPGPSSASDGGSRKHKGLRPSVRTLCPRRVPKGEKYHLLSDVMLLPPSVRTFEVS